MRRLRFWGSVATGLLLTCWFGMGWDSVSGDKYVVRVFPWLDLPVVPLTPGWHWTPPLLAQTRAYSRDVVSRRFAIGTSEPHLVDPSGAALAMAGSLRFRADEARLGALVRAVPSGDTDAWIDATLRDALRQLLAQGHVPAADPQGNALLAGEVGRRLAAVGLSLVALHLDAVGGPRDMDGQLAPPAAAGRVLVVGWDGADWNVIDPLLERGDLPHLEQLLSRGARARLKTVTPVLSPVVWTSIATGTGPQKHGIVDFLAVDRATGERLPVTSSLRQVPALWNIVSRHGLPVGVVAWWATWPAEKVVGTMVTDRIAYQLFGMGDVPGDSSDGKTWPPDLYTEIEPLVQRPEAVPLAQLRTFANLPDDLDGLSTADRELLDEFKTVLAATETYDAIALRLAGRDDPVLRCVYYEATDTAAHLFMRHRPPQMDGISEASYALWSDTVDAVYRDMDRRLGRLLQTVTEDTTVLVVSDHGFRTGDNRPVGASRIGSGRAAEWHRKFGIVVIAGAGVRVGAEIGEASVIDIAPTVLALLGLPVPNEMDGRVLETALTPAFLQAHPVLRQEGTRRAEASSDPVPSAADAAIVKRLQSLGYIGTESGSGLEQDEVTAFNNRATILLADGRPAEAVDELRRGLLRAPDAVPLRLNLARALRASGMDDEALTVLQAVVKARPDLADVHNLVGNIYLDRDDLGRAERSFQQALDIDPNSTGGHISMGLLRERQGDTAAAIKHYRRAATIDADAAEPFNNIGNVHRTMALTARSRGDETAATRYFAMAATAYEDGLHADPDFIGSYNNLALIYQDTQRPQEAMKLYRRALERDPRNAVVHNNLGSLYFAAGRLDEARQTFEEAIALDPEYESAYNNLGAVLGRLGQPEAELEAYRRAVVLDPDYADAQHNLGIALLRRGEDAAAEVALQRAIEINPDYVSALVTLGRLYMRGDRPAAAAQVFEAGLRVNPALIAVRNELAEAYLVAGERDRALAEYRRSLRENPDQPGVKTRLEELGASSVTP